MGTSESLGRPRPRSFIDFTPDVGIISERSVDIMLMWIPTLKVSDLC